MTPKDEVIASKEIRKAIDPIVAKLRSMPGCREISTAITKLQEGQMWVGMNLKRINQTYPGMFSSPPKSVEDCAKEAYERYGSVTDFKNFQGNPMPKWDELPEKIQEAWKAAATVPESPSAGNPYPTSKDPSTTAIEPTADGLKM